MTAAVKVLVVDDSATMRRLVADTLSRASGIKVIGEAANPLQARDAIKALNPDVMTLDVEMPEMDGLSFLEKVMRLRPMPVIMISTLTAKGSETAVAALALGAFDCVVKPTAANQNSLQQLPGLVRQAARMRFAGSQAPAQPKGPPANFRANDRIVAIGSSTGGVEALIRVLSQLPRDCAPTVITQHMPANFTASLAARLDRMCLPGVSEARDGAPLRKGQIYLAPGGERHLEISGRGALTCHLRASDLVNGHRPSVDVLFNSVAKAAGAQAVGVILTGMGRDGAAGLLAMRQAGARTIGQNEASSVVYGMPRAAFETGAVQNQFSLDRIGAEIVAATTAN